MKKINKVLSKENWIFEGKHIIPNLLEAANNILWLKTPLITTLFRQWKRYFTDKNQRERFTFLNNLQLTKVILSQYLGEENLDKKDNPRYAHQKKFKRVLKEYKRKVVEVKNEEDVKEFISGLLNS